MIPDLRSFSDIHTHSHKGPDIITSVEPDKDITDEYGTAWYSVGIHPWSTTSPIDSSIISRLKNLAHDRRVVAIGEAGFDKNAGEQPSIRPKYSSCMPHLQKKPVSLLSYTAWGVTGSSPTFTENSGPPSHG